jgi:hypothetical protein
LPSFTPPEPFVSGPEAVVQVRDAGQLTLAGAEAGLQGDMKNGPPGDIEN